MTKVIKLSIKDIENIVNKTITESKAIVEQSQDGKKVIQIGKDAKTGEVIIFDPSNGDIIAQKGSASSDLDAFSEFDVEHLLDGESKTEDTPELEDNN